MKCQCGFERLAKIFTDLDKEDCDSEKWILMKNLKFGKNNGVDVYACPKCGTLKIDVGE